MGESAERGKGRAHRRQAILDVAEQLFREEGYAAASMSSIAVRVGGSKATLYNYFPSKEAIFTALIEDHCCRVKGALFNLDAASDDIVVALKRLGVRYVRLMVSDDLLAFHRLVVAEAVRFPELGRALYEAGPRTGHAKLAGYLRDAMSTGRLRASDPAIASEHFMELCLSGIYRPRLWNVSPPPSDAEVTAHVDAALTTFMAAFGPRTPLASPADEAHA